MVVLVGLQPDLRRRNVGEVTSTLRWTWTTLRAQDPRPKKKPAMEEHAHTSESGVFGSRAENRNGNSGNEPASRTTTVAPPSATATDLKICNQQSFKTTEARELMWLIQRKFFSSGRSSEPRTMLLSNHSKRRWLDEQPKEISSSGKIILGKDHAAVQVPEFKFQSSAFCGQFLFRDVISMAKFISWNLWRLFFNLIITWSCFYFCLLK